jgi:hypothetical protein
VRVKNATRVDTVSVIQRNSLANQGCQHKKNYVMVTRSFYRVVGESGGDSKQGLVQKEKVVAKINKAKYKVVLGSEKIVCHLSTIRSRTKLHQT